MARVISSEQWTKMQKLFHLRGFVTQQTVKGERHKYRFGPAGTLLKKNISQTWWDRIVGKQEWMVLPVESGILSSQTEQKIRRSFLQECLDHYPTVLNMANRSLPFSMAHTGVCFASEDSNEKEDRFMYNAQEYTLLVTNNFCNPVSAAQHFDQLVMSRLLWWRKFAEHPSHFVDKVSGEEGSTVHINYSFPWGPEAVEVITNRGCDPLKSLTSISQDELKCISNKKSILPSMIECSTHLEGGMLAYLIDAYTEKAKPVNGSEDSEKRSLLLLNPIFAPYNVSITTTNNRGNDKRTISQYITKEMHDAKILTIDIGSPGDSLEEQFIRNDEMGVPFSVVIDNDTLDLGSIGVRHRDTTLMQKIHITELKDFLSKRLSVIDN